MRSAAITVLLFAALLAGCSDQSHDYRLTNIHTGEEIILTGEPYGHGWNTGLPGQDGGYYWWQVGDQPCDVRKVPQSEWRCERMDAKPEQPEPRRYRWVHLEGGGVAKVADGVDLN